MKIKFWGVRGSVPTPELDKIKVGGNTTCVEVILDNETRIIFDAGTGLVPLGKNIVEKYKDKKMPHICIFLTHTHWDHLYGFPFFNVIFQKGAIIDIYGPSKPHKSLEEMVLMQMDEDFCPINYKQLPAFINFFEIGEETTTLPCGTTITSIKHIHPGGAYSYRITSKGKVFVFNTDLEHYPTRLDERVVEISRNADFMVHDAQYTDDELEDHIGWGHSTWTQAIKVAQEANVKLLGFTHHDPSRSDDAIDSFEKLAQKQFPNSFFCKEGMVIDL